MKSFDHSDWKQNKGENIFIAITLKIELEF